jgi:serine phosphatase RsbU (regulator of sigma subunit)
VVPPPDSQPTDLDPNETDTGQDPGNEGSASGIAGHELVQALLPRIAPRVEGFDLAGGTAVEPTRSGRTVWTTFGIEGGRTVIGVLDVQSEATPPGLTLATARALLMEVGRVRSSPSKILAEVNDALTRTALEGGDPTVACGLLVVGADGVEWACAGQIQGGLIRRGGTFDELSSHGPPLGMLQGFQYGSSVLDLGPGDEAIVLTGASSGLFRGAADLVASLAGKPAGHVVSTVHKAIRKSQVDQPIETTVLFLRKH